MMQPIILKYFSTVCRKTHAIFFIERSKTNIFYYLRIVLLLIYLPTISFAQKIDTSKKENIDSSNAVLLSNYTSSLNNLEKQRVEDSLKKAILQEQLTYFKRDNKRKEVLLEQINQLEEKQTKNDVIKTKINSLRKTAKGYPVFSPFNDTLFLVYNKVGSFSAAERAEATSNRIAKLSKRRNFNSDSLIISDLESITEISYGESTLISVNESDALWHNISRQQLAESYKEKISSAITIYQSETNITELLKEIGLASALIAALALIIYYSLKLFKWTALKIKDQNGKLIKSFSVTNYTLLDSDRLTRVILFGNTIVKWFFIIFCIYISLPLLFAIFPWTSGLADKLLSYFIDPIANISKNIINYFPKLITIVVTVVVFHYVIKLFGYFTNEIKSGKLKINGFYPDWADPSFQIIRILLYAFMFTVIFPYLPGSDSPVFKGVSVFLGVLFTFGSSGSLSNIMSGLILTYTRAFKIGDRVKIGDISGDVIEKSLLVTRVRTIKNEIISVPNSNVMGSHTINYSSDAPENGLILHTTVTIGYDVPWKKIYSVLLEAALRTEYVLQDPQPFILQTSLEDFYVSYQLNAYTREPSKQARIYSELHQNIQDCCNEANIEIMSPHYRAGRDGTLTTIPEKYWKK